MGALTVVRRPFILSGDPVVLSASPGAPALVAGDELLTNGNMETGDPPSNWDAVNGATLSSVADERTGGAGSKSINIVTGVSYPTAVQSVATTVGAWYRLIAWARNVDSTGIRLVIKNDTTDLNTGDAIADTAWTQTSLVARAIGVTTKFGAFSIVSGNTRLDDVSAKPLPFDQTGVLEYIGDAGVKLGVAKANITVATGYQAGFVVCANSATAPTNHIYAYYDRTAGKAYLMNNATELVAATVTYSAAAELRVMLVGSVKAAYISLYYGGVLQGTVQGPYDLSDYGTHCHKFATSENETVDRFTFTRW